MTTGKAAKLCLLEAGTTTFRRRLEMSSLTTESWRPQLFSPTDTSFSKVKAALRRFFDIQAGSAWRDLSAILPQLSGALLDVGCGAQPFRSLIGPAVTYIGIDTVEAKDHFGYEIPDTIYFSGEIWPIADGAVDTVLCTETLEHVFATRVFLAQAARVLASEGTLVLTVPFAARWHFIPHDYWRFTPSCLRILLEEQGFENIRVYARGNGCTVACYKTMTLLLCLLMPQTSRGRAKFARQLAGLALLPLFLLIGVAANISLYGRGGDDCLGYTVFALRR